MSSVVIHTGAEASGNSSYLLGMTPETTSWYDPARTVGKTFTDPAEGAYAVAAAATDAASTSRTASASTTFSVN
jgi:hypothetical protein